MGRRILRWPTVAVAAMAFGLAACTSAADPPRLDHLSRTTDYLPGVAADVFLPDATGTSAPVVVLVPGGSWRSADRTGLRPLADSLAARGLVVVNATYRAADSGARFPRPVQDIACAVDFAVARARARAAGVAPRAVVLVGHSAGAQLAALAALDPARFRAGCPYPAARIDGFVGLAGPYNIYLWADLAAPIFARSRADDPATWAAADPFAAVAARAGVDRLSIVLVHGEADHDVPLSSSAFFDDKLRQAGYRVQLRLVPGADHAAVYDPAVVTTLLTRWIDSLPAGR